MDLGGEGGYRGIKPPDSAGIAGQLALVLPGLNRNAGRKDRVTTTQQAKQDERQRESDHRQSPIVTPMQIAATISARRSRTAAKISS